jgi:hypothetical protein
MKIFALLFLMGFSYFSYAFDDDIFYYKKLEHKGIKKTVRKTHDKWEVVSFFDEKGYVLRAINFYKKEIRSDCTYEYTITDTLLEIKRIDAIGKDVRKQKKIDRYYYTSLGHCYKYKVYFSESDTPSHYEHNFMFENGLLVSYTQGKIGAIKFVYKYNEKKQKVQKLEIRNETDTTFYSYAYNQLGQLTDCIQESNDNEVIYSDVVVWSNKKMNKIHIRYSNFDKHGNWTKSYFITEKGKKFRSKRKIEYYQ